MAAIFLTTFSNAFSWNENVWISIKISLKFVPRGPINNIPALVQIMAWRRQGDKPLSEPMMVILLTHICVTRPQWVNVILLQIFHIVLSPWKDEPAKYTGTNWFPTFRYPSSTALFNGCTVVSALRNINHTTLYSHSLSGSGMVADVLMPIWRQDICNNGLFHWNPHALKQV